MIGRGAGVQMCPACGVTDMRKGMSEAACEACLRRDRHDVWTATKSKIARQTRDRIGKVYHIERDRNGPPAVVHYTARHQLSHNGILCMVRTAAPPASSKSDLAKAFPYSRADEGLQCFPGRRSRGHPQRSCRAPGALLERAARTGSMRWTTQARNLSHAP
ncbi:transposase [Rhodobacteraceae bacterium]|nr:transposase [Paracoccaceae bacterium]